MDLLDNDKDERARDRLREIIRQCNPTAQIIDSSFGRVNPRRLLGTGLFDMTTAEQHPDWLREARMGEHMPETVEYGISSMTFQSRRPFHVERFEELTAIMETRAELVKDPKEQKESYLEDALEEEEEEEEEEKNGEDDRNSTEQSQESSSVSDAGRRAALCVIRSKGLVWLGSQQSHWQQGLASLAGRKFLISFAGPWEAAISGNITPTVADDATVERGVTLAQWQKPWGDRRTELVVIGQNMDHTAMRAALEACVLTDEEMEKYTELFLKAQPLDTLQEIGAVDDDLAKRIKRYEIEILAPKRKKTQVLQVAPKSTDAVSAHSCIAVFQSSDETKDTPGLQCDTVAQFRIERYLKYAHLIPELASGLVKEFQLPVDNVDVQTALLTEQVSGDALSMTIANLDAGDRVELEWLQIRVEYETSVDEDRYRMIEQCQKLTRLNDEEEKLLHQQYPQPQIMICKDHMGGSCNVAGPGEAGKTKAKDVKKGRKKGKKGRKKG